MIERPGGEQVITILQPVSLENPSQSVREAAARVRAHAERTLDMSMGRPAPTSPPVEGR